MTEWQKILITAIVSPLAVAGVVGLVRLFWRRREEAVDLQAKLSPGGDLALIQHVGCPCLMLTISSQGKRPAKIKGAKLSVEGVNIASAFQKGFGSDMGYTPVQGSREKLSVKFIGIGKPNSQDGWILERDDACRFFLPMLSIPIPLVDTAQSEDVTISVVFFDDSQQIVLKGLAVVNDIRSLLEVYGHQQYRLNPKLTVVYQVEVTSRTPPDPSLIGRTNPYPVSLDGGDG